MTKMMPEACEASEWPAHTGQVSGPCPSYATHMESWFDEEGVEVWLCDDHGYEGWVDKTGG